MTHPRATDDPAIPGFELGGASVHQAMRVWFYQEQAAQIVRSVVAALGPQGRVMPLKGTLTSRLFYEHPSQRSLSDCDLLVLDMPQKVALARIEGAGFSIRNWSDMLGVITMRAPGPVAFDLDLHFRPLPPGMGRVTAAWLATDARGDAELFGVPVVIPDTSRMLVYLLGNILKDHVYRARRTSATDIVRVLERSRDGMEKHARAIGDARLRRGAWMALEWAARVERSPLPRALQEWIGLSGRERVEAEARLHRLWRGADTPGLRMRDRIMARVVADDASDRVLALGAAFAGVTAGWWRNRGLRRL